MRHWSQLATRNWRAKLVRTLGAVLAVALGTGVVVWVTNCYESVRGTMLTWARTYVGAAQITIESPLGKYNQLPERIGRNVAAVEEVAQVTMRLVQVLWARPVTRAALNAPTTQTLQPEGRDDPRRGRAGAGEIDFHGIDLATEFAVRQYEITAGRMLRESDQYACVLEESLAKETGIRPGDCVLVWGESRPEPYELEVIGLMSRRRIARFQKGLVLLQRHVLQELNSKHTLVTSVDVLLKDPSEENVRKAVGKVRAAAQKVERNVTVRSAEARMRQIERAQGELQFVLVLLSCVAMLTALFIILSTLSMGMIERIAQLGLMRCIGMTAVQLALLVVLEVLPLGICGILAGIPIGLGLTELTVRLVPQYVGTFVISWWGLGLAAVAGLLTTLAAAFLPALAALRVSPLDATRPRARRSRGGVMFVVACVALILLLVQHYGMVAGLARSPEFVEASAAAVVTLYLFYATLAPLVVLLVGRGLVVVVAGLLGTRVRLLQDQVGNAVWRSAGICCGLMVGLSLIVGLVVFTESFKSGWQFPKQFPEAYVWSFEQLPDDTPERVATVAGIRNFTACNAINVIVEEKPLFMEQVYLSVTWFVGCEPGSFFDLLKVEFLEGDMETARRLLNEGGYVVVAAEFSRARNKHLGDEVKVYLGNQLRTFKIAGVMASPAIDIAAGYFEAHSEMNVAAVSSVLGSNADLRRHFGVTGFKLVLLNFALPDEVIPAGWPPRDAAGPIEGMPDYYYDERLSLGRRWQRFREGRLLREIRDRLEVATAFTGTVRELKDEIDRELTSLTQLLTAVPAVALLVAALGVANLMTANVAARMKQLAILRAVGATRGLILRMTIGEALVLGVLGSALGLLLGVHLAYNTTTMTQRMWGYDVPLTLPWYYIGASVVLTVGLCILAGILPARHAARTNVVDALHVA